MKHIRIPLGLIVLLGCLALACETAPIGNPLPGEREACCYDDGTCSNEPAADCTAKGGRPQGADTLCEETGCPPPREACCFENDGSCSFVEAFDCLIQGGVPQGGGTDCATTSCPLVIPDGAYGGPVIARVVIDGETIATNAAYYVVEIRDGNLVNLRQNLDANGPFPCWPMNPGSQRTTNFPGTESHATLTVIEAEGLRVSLVIEGSLGSDVASGEGTITVERVEGGLQFSQVQQMTGTLGNMTLTVRGVLERIGELGRSPAPNGMNGVWALRYVNGGADGVQIRKLRVIEFVDVNGTQELFSSQPVTASTAPGDGVFISFEATTVFESDPTPRLYTITFRGDVDADGQIAGETTFATAGKDPRVLDTVLERVPSPEC